MEEERNEEVKAPKKKSTMKIFAVILVLFILGAGGFLGFKIYRTQQDLQTANASAEPTQVAQVEPEPEPVKQIDIYQGNDRPIAVMIDNHTGAWPQAGLNEAYAVYEIIVEGGESRLMAVFKGKDLAKIGPIRSARHYFLDYALENDAIYVHYGQSPQAESDIKTLGIQNVNGLIYSSKDFWRVKDKAAPHNAVTSTANILEIAKEKKGYRTTTAAADKSVLNYVADEVKLADGIDADEITIPYSKSNKVSYTYNPSTKRYIRYSRNKVQKDWDTEETVTTKNIIITFAKNYDLKDTEDKGRQELVNIGTLDGYYITNGKAIKITCEKTKRNGKTIYRNEAGEEIEVNDGNTFFQICPIDANVTIEATEKEEESIANTTTNTTTNTTKPTNKVQ